MRPKNNTSAFTIWSFSRDGNFHSRISIIPLAAFLVYKNSNSNLVLGLWFIPIILIPFIWIAYSVSIGHFDVWLKDSIFQAHRSRMVFCSMMAIFQIDPVLSILSIAGVIFAAIKRDPFMLSQVSYLMSSYHLPNVLSRYSDIAVFCSSI
jgi:hypothetical protein